MKLTAVGPEALGNGWIRSTVDIAGCNDFHDDVMICLGYLNNLTCSRLPLNVSDLLSRALPVSSSFQLSGLESLDQELKLVSPGTIEGFYTCYYFNSDINHCSSVCILEGVSLRRVNLGLTSGDRLGWRR